MDFLERVEEGEDHIYLYGSTLDNIDIATPLILKLTKDGCLVDDCKGIQVYGDRPAPTHSVSSRNIWHVYDKETEEQFRYTFLDQYIPVIGGTLLRSDEMSGDDWYSTGRRFLSAYNYMFEEITLVEGVDRWAQEYKYDLEKDDYIELNQFIFGDHRYLSVTSNDSIPFNDGRQMRRLTLQCYESEANGGGVVGEMTHVPPMTWIDYIGNPDDLFNSFNACDSVRGSEVVTCFYSADQMMWSHPEYGGMCTTSTDDTPHATTESLLLYPNPSHEAISLSKAVTGYQIIDLSGQIVSRGGSVPAEGSIDVSALSAGQYYLYELPFRKGSCVSGFIKL